MGQLYDESNRMSINAIELSYSAEACNTTAFATQQHYNQIITKWFDW